MADDRDESTGKDDEDEPRDSAPEADRDEGDSSSEGERKARADREATDEDASPGSERPSATASATGQAPAGGYSRRAVIVALAAGFAAGAGSGIGGTYYWLRYGRRRRRPAPPLGRAYAPIEAWNPRKGANPAKVTIVEFSDFQ